MLVEKYYYYGSNQIKSVINHRENNTSSMICYEEKGVEIDCLKVNDTSYIRQMEFKKNTFNDDELYQIHERWISYLPK